MNNSHYEYDFTDDLLSRTQSNPIRLKLESVSRSLMASVSPRMADLLDVVMAVYAADRRSLRNYKGVNTGQREVSIRLTLRDPDFWNRAELKQSLCAYLYWVSEDVWSFEFATRQAPPTHAESKLHLFDSLPQQPITVSLFSGGLDSLAGLFAHRQDRRSESHVLVSGYSHGPLLHRQKQQASRIESMLCGCGLELSCPTLRHVTVPYGLCQTGGNREEKSQRTRATAFLTFGMITTLLAQTDTLWVYENGTGALNLPLNATQLGVDNYRGVHPRSLIMAQKLFELALEQRVRIVNPFIFTTKAHMLRALPSSGLVDLVRETVSCDGYPVRVAGRPQCGNCTSCILRRQALHSSGLSAHDVGEEYQHDVLTNGHMLDSKHRFGLEVMRDHVQKLKLCLSDADPWTALAAQYPELARTAIAMESNEHLKPGEATAGMLALYQTYVGEWDALPPKFG